LAGWLCDGLGSGESVSVNWRQVLDGPKWIPMLTAVEIALQIPAGLLARMSYQESHFRPEIISGVEKSPAGALGILQLMPQFWSTVRRPVPFYETDTADQINEAAGFLVHLYSRFGKWSEALAAYNFGPGNEEKYLEHRIATLPKETVDYVVEILTDVPIPGELV
jgi:soluble lytic murein transglycosylase-like protein